MADVITSIQATGGDYTDVTSWEADLGGATSSDFVTNTEVVIGEIANENISETSVLVLGATTNSTYKWVLRAQSGAEHGGIPGAGARVTFSTTSAAFQARNFIDIEGIELIGSASSTNVIIQAHPFEDVSVNVNRCILNGNGATNSNNHGFDSRNRLVTDTIKNTLFFDFGGFAIAAFYTNPTVNIYNCGAADCNLSDNASRGGFHAGQSKYTYTNCFAYNCGSTNQADFFSSGATLSYCASTDTTATGTGAVTGIGSGDFNNAASNDWHLSGTGSNLYNAGTDLSGSGVTTDIDQETWSTWSIGFDHVAAAGATITLVGDSFTLTTSALGVNAENVITFIGDTFLLNVSTLGISQNTGVVVTLAGDSLTITNGTLPIRSEVETRITLLADSFTLSDGVLSIRSENESRINLFGDSFTLGVGELVVFQPKTITLSPDSFSIVPAVMTTFQGEEVIALISGMLAAKHIRRRIHKR